MRKLIVHEWISLDGYTTDRDGKLDFFAPTVREIYAGDYHKQILETIDCILFGRKTYEQFAAVWPDRSIEGDLLALKMNTAKKIVFSRSITKAPWGKWKELTVETGDPVSSIRKLKSSQGKNLIIWGSVSLVQLLMRNKLVDEFHVTICPIITGGGKKLFQEAMGPTALTLLESKQYDGGILFMNYRVNN